MHRIRTIHLVQRTGMSHATLHLQNAVAQPPHRKARRVRHHVHQLSLEAGSYLSHRVT